MRAGKLTQQLRVVPGTHWLYGALAVGLFLSGCGVQKVVLDEEAAALAPAEIMAGCCDGVRLFADWMIELADANADILGRLGLIHLRPGHLTRQSEAQALLEAALRPLDVVVFHSGNRMSGHLIPGRFTHAAVYIGTEDQLRATGLWHLPAITAKVGRFMSRLRKTRLERRGPVN